MSVIGIASYGRLGQSEDPPFTFKFMTIRTIWPGASVADVDQQLTERLINSLFAAYLPGAAPATSFSQVAARLFNYVSEDSAPGDDVALLAGRASGRAATADSRQEEAAAAVQEQASSAVAAVGLRSSVEAAAEAPVSFSTED